MSTSVDERVAANVRAALGRRSLSQTALARALGMSQSAVSRRLVGATSWTIAELTQVADTLDIRLDSLLAADDSARRVEPVSA